jgi:hypothetical protein
MPLIMLQDGHITYTMRVTRDTKVRVYKVRVCGVGYRSDAAYVGRQFGVEACLLPALRDTAQAGTSVAFSICGLFSPISRAFSQIILCSAPSSRTSSLDAQPPWGRHH